jgi:Tol biopolymer transport system component
LKQNVILKGGIIMKRKREFIILIVIATVLIVNRNIKGDFTFGTPIPVPNINSEYVDGGPRISSDDLTLFFVSSKPGWDDDDWDLWVTTRADKDDSWGEPENLGPIINTPFEDGGPSISTDGLSLYFHSARAGGYGRSDIWVTTRATLEDEWGEPRNLGPNVNSPEGDAATTISADGLTLYFCSDRPGPGGLSTDDFWVTRRQTVDDDWGPAENLGPPICSQYCEWTSDVPADGLTFFFSDWTPARPSGFGWGDLWMSRRSTISDTWSEPVNLGASINSQYDDGGVSITADGSTIYFHSNRPGGPGSWDIWQASIDPVVDLNGDGIVNAEDMCIVVDNWGTDNSLCDIGPMPWGDGIVDVQDLIVLAEHLFEEIPPTEPAEPVE